MKFVLPFILLGALSGFGQANIEPTLPAADTNCTLDYETVELTWLPSASANVVGYDLYYGGVNGDFTNSVLVGNVTNYIFTNLQPCTVYYFVATSVASNGVESVFSQTAIYTPPTFQLVISDSIPTLPIIEEDSTDLVHWASVGGITLSNLQLDVFTNPLAGKFSRWRIDPFIVQRSKTLLRKFQ